MKIAISAESSADLTKELQKKFNIHTIPLTIILGDKEITDNETVSSRIFDFVSQTKIMPKTCAINEYQFREYFENLLKDYDAVIHISMSSHISCTCANAMAAAKNMKNVYVIDSLSLCAGIGLLAIQASKLNSQGASCEQIIKQIKKLIPQVRLNFVPNKLDYLKNGGRVTALQLLGANLLKIHPTITMKDGKTGVGKKYIGNMDICFKKLCEDVVAKYNPDKSLVLIAYTTITDKQLQFAYDFLKEQGFEEIYDVRANGTISSHCGESAMGIMFFEQ